MHWYRRGHRFKSRTGLNFFQALFPLFSHVHHCEDHFHIQIPAMLDAKKKMLAFKASVSLIVARDYADGSLSFVLVI